MRHILFLLLFISSGVFAQNKYTIKTGVPSLITVVSDISALENFSASATTVIVSDSLRGGVFNYFPSGLTIDNGLVFPATGKGSGYWKRQTTPSQGINITWFGARPDSSATFNGLVINSLSAAGYKELYVPTYIHYDPEQIVDANSDDLKLVDDYNQSIVFGHGAVLSTPISNPTHLSLQPLRKDKVTGLWISGKDPYPQSADSTGAYNSLKMSWEDLESQIQAGTNNYGDFGLTLQKGGHNGFGAVRFNNNQNGDFTGDWPSMEFTFQNNSPTYKAMTIALLKPQVNGDGTGLGFNYGGRDKAFWYPGRPTLSGEYVISNYKVYRAATSGTTGENRPIHNGGFVPDGGVTWQYVENTAPYNTGLNWRPAVIFGATDEFTVTPYNNAAVHFAERALIYPRQGFDFLNGTKDVILGTIAALSQTAKGLKFIADTATDKYISISDSRFKLGNVPLIPTILTKPSGDTTFSIATGDAIAFNDATPTNFTQFTDGIVGQRITVSFNTANTTLIESANLRLNGAGNITPPANSAIEFAVESNTTVRLIGLASAADTATCGSSFVDIDGNVQDNASLDSALATKIMGLGIAQRMAFWNGTNSLSSGASIFIDSANNRIGLLTNAPTHTLTFAQGNTGIVNYNTIDQVTNYERFRSYWNSNVWTMATDAGGTGTNRPIAFSANGSVFTMGHPSKGFEFTRNGANIGSIVNIGSSTGNALTGSSGVQSGLQIDPTISQTGTAGYNGLYISPFENTTGSGSKLLIDAGTNSAAQNGGTHTSKFSVDNAGNVVINNTATAGIRMYNTSDRVTNYERGVFSYNSNVMEIGTEFAGTGTTRSLRIGIGATAGGAISNGRNITFAGSAPLVTINHNSTDITGNLTSITGTYQGSSGTQSIFTINPTFNQSGTASYEAFAINATETATGSGTKTLFKAAVGGTNRFLIDNTGATTINSFFSLTNTTGNGYVQLANGSTPATPTSAIRVFSNAGGFSFVNSSGDVASIYASTGTATFTIPAGTNTAATLTGAQVLTNKTIDGGSNTLSNISSTSLATAAARGYALQATHGSSNYAASTVYYFGNMGGNITTVAQRNKIYIPANGTIKKAYVSYFVGGTLASTEAITLAIRLNNTTDYTINNTATLDGVTTAFNNASLNIAVSAGDFIELKLTTPAFVTAPTTVRCSVVLFVE